MYQSKNLQCLTKRYSTQAYYKQRPDVFAGTGCFPGPPYHIQVDPSVTPKQTPLPTSASTSQRAIQARN